MLGIRSIGHGGWRDGLCGGRNNIGLVVDVDDDTRGGRRVSRPVNRDFSSCLDPDYRQFLELLRVDGKAYSAELSVSDGLSFVLAYEVGYGARVRDAGKRSSKGSNAGPVGGQHRPLAMCGSREQNGKEDDGVIARGYGGPKGSKRKLKDISTGVGPQHVKKRASEAGPCRRDMQTSKLLVEKRNRKGPSAGPVGGQTRPLAMRGSGGQTGKEADVVLMKCSQRENVSTQGDRGPEGSKRKFKDISTDVKPRPGKKRALEAGSCGSNMQASKPLELQNFQVENEECDENYLNYLNSQKMDAIQESSSDSDVLILDYNPSKNLTPLVVLDCDEEEVSNNICDRSHCPLLKKLLELLQQPYDKSELKAHMERFRHQAPKYSQKETRSGHILKTEIPGRSYEYWHEDIAAQIRSSKEEPRTLNLLRGFFFWLENNAHESMFKPWEDPSCLAVLPVVETKPELQKPG